MVFRIGSAIRYLVVCCFIRFPAFPFVWRALSSVSVPTTPLLQVRVAAYMYIPSPTDAVLAIDLLLIVEPYIMLAPAPLTPLCSSVHSFPPTFVQVYNRV